MVFNFIFALTAALIATPIARADTAPNYCPVAGQNYCPGQGICDTQPEKCDQPSSCGYRQGIWLKPADGGAPFCYYASWYRDDCVSGGQVQWTWLSTPYDCDPINPVPGTEEPGGGGSGGNSGGAPAPAPQPLVLLGGNGLLDCPVGAVDCACPANTGSSDSASCGPSAFSNFMVESMSRQAASSTVTDYNLRAADALGGDREGIE